jgi:hypothetical protein
MLTVGTYVEVEPQDIAMDAFRSCFSLVSCVVDQTGTVMKYPFKNEAMAKIWLANAEAVIIANNLPLIATVDVWKTGALVHNVSLNIIYKP